MKNCYFFFIFFICINIVSHAQFETANWYFGNNAGLDFSSGVPVSVSGGQTVQWEGVSSMSNASGNLLFYTDGITVWDKNHNQMPNGFGLDGDWSSTQSAMIVRQPGSTSLYFIFTCDNEANPDGFRYSTVDMTLNSGLGDVVLKNIPLYAPTCEKISAVKHFNGQDIWVLSHQWNSNNFVAYLLTSTGLNLTPVISGAGSLINGNTGNTIGYMKISPSGCKIACAVFSAGFFEMYDFNNQTGVVSNALTFPSNYPRIYGVEFSPDGSKLYLAGNDAPSDLYEYDLSSGTVAGILATQYIVVSFPGTYDLGALQLGPDNKIYSCRNAQSELGVINTPNGYGAACNYVSSQVILTSGVCQLGLPTFVQSFFTVPDSISAQIFCSGTPSQFEIITSSAVSVDWTFGDPLSGSSNQATGFSVSHNFSDTGSYNILAIVHHECYDDSIFLAVTISGVLPHVDLGNDTTLCQGNVLLLDAANSGSTYLWQNGSTASTYQVSVSGTYSVSVTNSCGVDMDTINVNFNPLPNASLGPDVSLCTGDSITLVVNSNLSSFLWQNGSTQSTFTVTQSGSYWVQVTNSCGIATDTIVVSSLIPPTVNLGNDTSMCIINSIALNASFPGSSYLWQDGSTSPVYQASSSGLYWVVVTNACGIASDSVNLNLVNTPVIDLGNDTTLCNQATIILDAGNTGALYNWQDGSNQQTITVDSAGLYWVNAFFDSTCRADDSILISYAVSPYLSLGNDTTICYGDAINLVPIIADSSDYFTWQNGSHNISFETAQSGLFILAASNFCGTARDSIHVLVVDCSCDLHIPNAFSPNSDGLNDLFHPLYYCPVYNYNMKIFNRWGQLIFETSDVNQEWDGKYQGIDSEIGVYIYLITYQNSKTGEDRLLKGNVTLVR